MLMTFVYSNQLIYAIQFTYTHTYTLSYTLMANLPHMDKDDRDSQRQQREQYTNQIKTDDAN